jgi:patatin-like phospholipase/acyl hydrolase
MHSLAVTDSTPRRILALDGGGIRCLIAIEVLAAMERQLAIRLDDPGFRLCRHFALVAGTSGGAIVATALALGISMQEIRNFVVGHARIMFRGARWFERFRSLYDKRELERSLQDWLGADTTLGSTRLRTLLMLVMSNWSTDSPWVVSNNPAALYNARDRSDCNLDLPLWQLARASAAAPIYYVPETIGFGRSQDYRFIFVDGGLTGFLNPAFKAFVYATSPAYRLNWPVGEDRITLLSIGSGEVRHIHPHATVQDLGVVSAIKSMPGTLLNSTVREQDLLCRTFGRCITGEPIDTEIGDLIGSPGIAQPPMFTYHRVNVALSNEGLDSIGCGHITAANVRAMDAVDQIDAYIDIGRALAARRLGAYLAGCSLPECSSLNS